MTDPSTTKDEETVLEIVKAAKRAEADPDFELTLLVVKNPTSPQVVLQRLVQDAYSD